MLIEFFRLAFGFLIILFHRRIADFILERERSLVVLFRQRGVPLPDTPSTGVVHNVYFFLGTFVVVYQLIRIFWLLHAS